MDKLFPRGRISSLIFKIRLYFANPVKRSIIVKPYVHHMGENVALCTTAFSTEPYLISIEDNVTCAAGVKFITHDASVFKLMNMKPGSLIDQVGPIILHENCFVGAYTILMPNIEIGRNSIVAAGSVVTKRIPDNEVWGGNPAKFIMKVEDLLDKRIEQSKTYPWLLGGAKLSGEELVKSRVEYYFKR